MLEYKDVSIAYNHDVILEHIDVSFPDGVITALVGPNGCGKSTLLQAVIGSTNTTSGIITLDGENLHTMDHDERAKDIAYMPQIRTTIPSLSVGTLVEHGRFPYMGFTKKKSKHDVEMVSHAMEAVGIVEYKDQPVDTLSGGIRQKAYLAMVLAQDSKYIILDEPTTYLDPKAQRDFLMLLKEIKKLGKTIIVVLHDLNHIVDIADYIVVMEDRKIVYEGEKDHCIDSGVIEEVFHVRKKEFSDDEGRYVIYI